MTHQKILRIVKRTDENKCETFTVQVDNFAYSLRKKNWFQKIFCTDRYEWLDDPWVNQKTFNNKYDAKKYLLSLIHTDTVIFSKIITVSDNDILI